MDDDILESQRKNAYNNLKESMTKDIQLLMKRLRLTILHTWIFFLGLKASHNFGNRRKRLKKYLLKVNAGENF